MSPDPQKDPLAPPVGHHDPLAPTGASSSGNPQDRTQPAIRSHRLRYSRPLQIPAGAEWPACDPNGATPPKRFRWLMVENRAVYASGNDAYVSLTDKPAVADPTSWYMTVPAGTKRIRCVAGPRNVEATPLRLRILNAGSAAIVVWVEADDDEIIDTLEKLWP